VNPLKYLTAAILFASLLFGCSGSDSGSTSGVSLQKTDIGESGVIVNSSTTEEIRHGTDQRLPVIENLPSNVQSAGGLTVDSPNGGEKWAVGTVQRIDWKKDKKGPNVIIRVITRKKLTDVVVLKTKNDGSHSWKIPSSFKTGKNYKIDVQSFTGHYACAYWSDYLTYQPSWGRAIVSKKNDGLNKFVTCWNSAGGNAAKDQCWSSCVSKYGSCSVIDVDGNVCKSTATAYDSSDKYFTITKASGGGGGGSSLKVSTPNGGESWTTGKSYDLKWSKGNAGANVKIELLKSGKASLTISKKTKNDGKHKWKVPSSVKTGSKYKIRITSSTKKTVTDSSDKNFTITKSGGGGGGGGGGGTCTMYATVIGPDGWTDYPGKKVCVGRTPTDPALVCATTKAADLNRATLKNVPKKKLNIYPCGSRYKYIHGVDARDCDDVFTIHASSEWGDSGAAGKDWDKKCGW